jgi:hypothetical protein
VTADGEVQLEWQLICSCSSNARHLLAERKVDPEELHRCMNRICARGPFFP